MTRRVFETGGIYYRKYGIYVKYCEVLGLCENIHGYHWNYHPVGVTAFSVGVAHVV